MNLRSRFVLALSLAISMLLISAVSAAAFPPEFGISQSYRNFGLKTNEGPYDPYKDVSKSIYWAPLNVKRLRVIIPWDIAGRPAGDGIRQEFQAWLNRANQLGADPYVVFGPTERTPSTDEAHSPAHWSNVQTRFADDSALVAPPGLVYKTAIKDFLDTWGPGTAGDVREIGAWNEPNVGKVNMAIPGSIDGPVYLPGGTTKMTDCPGASFNTCGPLAAAWYWEHAVEGMIEECGFGNGNDCEVVAGEFASAPGNGTSSEAWQYWTKYANKIYAIGPFVPELISFHAHRDAEELGANNVYNEKGEKIGNHDCKSGQKQWCVTTTFREWMTAYGWTGLVQIWNTETGARWASGESQSSADTAQNNRFNWLTQISDEANVRRLYYFNFQGSGTDRGLIDSGSGVDTRNRTIWNTIRCRNGCSAWSPPPAPTVQTIAASGVQMTQATLNGTVNPNGANTGYHFEYGTADCSSNPCSAVPAADAYVGNGTSAVAESAGITGLQAGTTYHFRIVATSSRGVSKGADQTFTAPLSSPSSAGELAGYNHFDGSHNVYFRGTNGHLWQAQWGAVSKMWSQTDLGGSPAG